MTFQLLIGSERMHRKWGGGRNFLLCSIKNLLETHANENNMYDEKLPLQEEFLYTCFGMVSAFCVGAGAT